MITIPLHNGSPCLRFISSTNINQVKYNTVLTAKIDTGAQCLMIPVKKKHLFSPKMTEEIRTFNSASGHSLKSERGKIYAKIQNLGIFFLDAYFYEGERILFGIKEFTKNFTLSIDKTNLYVNIGDKLPQCNSC